MPSVDRLVAGHVSDAVHRREARAAINLGSNELLHRDLIGLHARAFPIPTSHASYPTHEVALEATATVWGLPSSEVLFTAGSDAAIRAIHYSLVVRGGFERTVVPLPNYPAWQEASTFFGTPFVGVPQDPGNANTLQRLRKEVTPRSLVAVSWPNGPVGSAEELSELEDLARWCRLIDALLVVDGCYVAFHSDLRTMIKRIRCAGGAVIMSGSKMFGLAGARIAVTHGEPDFIARVTASASENAVSQLALDAWAGCLGLMGDFEQVWSDIATRRDEVAGHLRRDGVTVPTSHGNFLHVVLPEESARRSVNRAADCGFRVKMNSLPGGTWSMRFAVGEHPDFARFIEILPTILAEVN